MVQLGVVVEEVHRLKIVSVVGARPQFIKMATVSRAIAAYNRSKAAKLFQHVAIHTGQHYDPELSQVFFEELHIPKPKYNLNVGSASHGVQTGEMLIRLERVLEDERPELVLLYGDTNSTLAGAIAAAKLCIPIAHVEAGLRSYNKNMPEEINRVLTDHVSEILFCPTRTAVSNLEAEGLGRAIANGKCITVEEAGCINEHIQSPEGHLIVNVGDVMFDAALFYGKQAEETSSILDRLEVRPREYVLVTVHRAENTDDAARLRAIFQGLIDVARHVTVVTPLHPRTMKALQEHDLIRGAEDRLRITEPVGYLDMLKLERNAGLIATDSGGVQKEAYFFRVPCVTLRHETEWVELMEIGWNTLLPPTSADSITEGIHGKLHESLPISGDSPFGDGRAAEKVAQVLQQWQKEK